MVVNSEKVKLDQIDVEILRILQADGRISNAKLAARVGLTAPPMLERVKKLERGGVIRGYKAILDARLLGMDFFVFVAVNLDVIELSEVSRFERELGEMEEVLECHHIAGDIDFLLKVNVRDQEHYKAFVTDRLAKIKGINRLHSWVVLDTIKDSREFAIAAPEQK